MDAAGRTRNDRRGDQDAAGSIKRIYDAPSPKDGSRVLHDVLSALLHRIG